MPCPEKKSNCDSWRSDIWLQFGIRNLAERGSPYDRHYTYLIHNLRPIYPFESVCDTNYSKCRKKKSSLTSCSGTFSTISFHQCIFVCNKLTSTLMRFTKLHTYIHTYIHNVKNVHTPKWSNRMFSIARESICRQYFVLLTGIVRFERVSCSTSRLHALWIARWT